MEKLTFKWKKGDEHTLLHTDVFYDGTYIGYLIKESLQKRSIS